MSQQEFTYQYQDKPLQLINFDGPKFTLNEEAMELIRNIKEEIIVVSIVGKARTGKSFLMNTLLELNGKGNTGFEVSSTINSCTKGIWLWGNIKKKVNSNAKIIFVDSEGTSSFDRSTKTYDSKIFALVVLISSLFIYNTTSNIDEQGISELSLAAHLSNSIAVSTSSKDSDKLKDEIITELAPKFIWLLRDFSLEKIHPDTEEEITSKEYLELCLNKKLAGKNATENNIIRDNIIKYFHDRDCYTLPRPVDDEDDLKRLNQIPFDKLNSEFKIDFMNLKQEVFKNCQSKKFKGKRLTGSSLYELLQLFVKSINEGGIPNIVNAWETVIMNDIKNHFDKALKFFKQEESLFESELNGYNQKRNDFEGKFKLINVLRGINNSKKEAMSLYLQVLMNNRDSYNMNKAYMNFFEEKKIQLIQELHKMSNRMIVSYNETTEKSNINIFKSETKDIDKKANDRFYEERNLLEYCENEEEAYSKLKPEFNGENAVSCFIEELKNLHSRVLKSIEYNISLFHGMKFNETKKQVDQLNFEIDVEKEKAENLKEKLVTQESRLKNKLADKELNNKEINLLEERVTEIQERINIKKQAEIARKQNLIQKEELEKEEKIKAEYEAEVKRKQDEENPIKMKKIENLNKKKNDGCGCGCLIF
jgi:hypothetical protein